MLLVLADALRSDMVRPDTMPYLASLAGSRMADFKEHFSGGNSSRMGVFSLFYGLPPGYWSSFEGMQRSPVLIDQFQAQAFELGLFSSSTMYRPVSLDRTAFAGVSKLRLRTEPADAPAWERDTQLTGEWFEWLERRDPDRPFFGFLFYDATNAQDYPPGTDAGLAATQTVSEEFTLRFGDYRRAARFVDRQIESVMADLEQRGLDDRTIVIISSDHGEEFDESGQGLQDHGSGYTRYQLQVPFLVHWPGRPPRSYTHRTSHYDLVPTLMQHALGCAGPSTDYASGKDLFSGQDWPWLLVGSYYNYAVLEPDQVTITYPNGSFEVRDSNYRLLRDPVVRGDILQAVTRENSRFYSK